MDKRDLPAIRAATALESTRQEVEWISDEDLPMVEYKEAAVAGSLSFFTGGGGQVYNRKYVKGIGLMIASIAALTVLPGPLAVLAYFAIGTASAVAAIKDTKKVNRWVTARSEYQRLQHDDSLQLVKAMRQSQLAGGNYAPPGPVGVTAHGPVAADQTGPVPGPYAAILDRLRKLGALHLKGVMTDLEYKGRKIDILSEFSALPAEEIDNLLYALMPLLDEGAITREDIDFLKQLG